MNKLMFNKIMRTYIKLIIVAFVALLLLFLVSHDALPFFEIVVGEGLEDFPLFVAERVVPVSLVTYILVVTIISYIYFLYQSYLFLITRKEFITTLSVSLSILAISLFILYLMFGLSVGISYDAITYIGALINFIHTAALFMAICIGANYLYTSNKFKLFVLASFGFVLLNVIVFVMENYVINTDVLSTCLYAFWPYTFGASRTITPQLIYLAGAVFGIIKLYPRLEA